MWFTRRKSRTFIAKPWYLHHEKSILTSRYNPGFITRVAYFHSVGTRVSSRKCVIGDFCEKAMLDYQCIIVITCGDFVIRMLIRKSGKICYSPC